MGCVIALVLVNKHFDMFGQRRMFTRRDGCFADKITITGSELKRGNYP